MKQGAYPRNKTGINMVLREMIMTALSNAGGVRYLTRQANQNPAAFMSLLAKVLPMQIEEDAHKVNETKLVIDLSKLSDAELAALYKEEVLVPVKQIATTIPIDRTNATDATTTH